MYHTGRRNEQRPREDMWWPGPPRRCRSRIKETIQQEDLTQILPNMSPGAPKTKRTDETHGVFQQSLRTALILKGPPPVWQTPAQIFYPRHTKSFCSSCSLSLCQIHSELRIRINSIQVPSPATNELPGPVLFPLQ